MSHIKQFLLGALSLFGLLIFSAQPALARTLSPGELRKMGVYFVTPTNFSTSVEGSADGSGACYELALPKANDLAAFANAIDTYLTANAPAGSPFQGLGADFVQGAVRRDINPMFVIGNLRVESNYGTAGGTDPATLQYKLQENFNAFGRTAGSSQSKFTHNGRDWYVYPSWKESINSIEPGRGDTPDQPALMRAVYLDQGKLTIGQYIGKYAPGTDGNDESAYGRSMKDTISKIVALAGDALSCTDAETVITPTPRTGPR